MLYVVSLKVSISSTLLRYICIAFLTTVTTQSVLFLYRSLVVS
jgi:hypothetical protein